MLWLDMTSPSWSPFSELRRIQNQMNHVFGGRGGGVSAYPPVNLWGNDESLLLTAELPGVSPEDVDIKVQGRQISLEGTKKVPQEKEASTAYRREREEGAFSRVIAVPFEIDSEKVSARFADGVLKIELPRSESAKPRKISINT